MHAATGTTSLLPLLQCDFRGQPSVVESSSPFFRRILFISVNTIPLLLCTAVFPVSRICVPCVTRVCAVCHTWGALEPFLVGSLRFRAGEAFFAVSATDKERHALTY